MITVALSNKDCIFDSGMFDTVREAIEFSKGRGGKYTVQIGLDSGSGTTFSYDSDSDTFSRFTGWDCETIPENKISI